MKYEMIFGDGALFDGAPDDAEYAGWFCQETRWYMILNGKILFSDGGSWCTSDNPYLSADIAAMRRIIKEPKRWTWEDKKAGVLPEVGAKCRQGHKDEIVVAVTEKFVVTECQDMSVCTTRKDVFMRSYNPIETPAEKSQREEDAFFFALKDEWQNPKSPPISSASFEVGARAAYRKLKGGE
jgi:hypothetical protein